MTLYALATLDENGNIGHYLTGGGRGNSANSVRAFDNLVSARRSRKKLLVNTYAEIVIVELGYNKIIEGDE